MPKRRVKKSPSWWYGRGFSASAKARRDGRVTLRKKIVEEQIASATKLIQAGMDPEEAYARFGSLQGLVARGLAKGIVV